MTQRHALANNIIAGYEARDRRRAARWRELYGLPVGLWFAAHGFFGLTPQRLLVTRAWTCEPKAWPFTHTVELDVYTQEPSDQIATGPCTTCWVDIYKISERLWRQDHTGSVGPLYLLVIPDPRRQVPAPVPEATLQMELAL